MIVALFATGMRLDRRLRGAAWRSTALLLGVVMPLTIAAVAVFGVSGMGLSAGAAIVLGAALAAHRPGARGRARRRAARASGDETEPALRPHLRGGAQRRPGLPLRAARPGRWPAEPGAGGHRPRGSPPTSSTPLWRAWRSARRGWAPVGAWRPGCASASLVARELDGWAALGAVLAIYGAHAGGSAATASSPPSRAASRFRRRERDHEYNHGVHAGAETLETRARAGDDPAARQPAHARRGSQAPGARGLAARAAAAAADPPGGLRRSASSGSPPAAAASASYVGWFGVRGVGSLYYAAAAVGARGARPRRGARRSSGPSSPSSPSRSSSTASPARPLTPGRYASVTMRLTSGDNQLAASVSRPIGTPAPAPPGSLP